MNIKEYEIKQKELKSKISRLKGETKAAEALLKQAEEQVATLNEEANEMRSNTLPPGFTIQYTSLMLRGEYITRRDSCEELYSVAWEMWDNAAKIINISFNKTPIAFRRKDDGLLFVLHKDGEYHSVDPYDLDSRRVGVLGHPEKSFNLSLFDRCYVED